MKTIVKNLKVEGKKYHLKKKKRRNLLGDYCEVSQSWGGKSIIFKKRRQLLGDYCEVSRRWGKKVLS